MQMILLKIAIDISKDKNDYVKALEGLFALMRLKEIVNNNTSTNGNINNINNNNINNSNIGTNYRS